MFAQVVGDPGTGGGQADQLTQGHGVFDQQGQVHAASADAFEQGQQAADGVVRVVLGSGRPQQQGNEFVQPRLSPRGSGGVGAAFAEGAQATIQIVRLFESAEGQGPAGLVVVQGAFPASRQVRAVRFLGVVALRRAEGLVELGLDVVAVTVQLQFKGVPGGESHGEGEPDPAGLVVGQGLGLLVGVGLKAVFGPAQENVGVLQLVHGETGHQIQVAEDVQHLAQSTLAQTGFVAAADELEGLGDELHFANAAGAEFDVFVLAFALHLPGDHRLHFAQGFERPVIQIAPVDERSQGFHDGGAGLQIPGDRARLDHGVALPFPAYGFVIVFKGVEGKGEGAGCAVGTKAHIHPEYEAFGGFDVQRLDEALAQANEVFAGSFVPGAFYGAVVRVDEDQINI